MYSTTSVFTPNDNASPTFRALWNCRFEQASGAALEFQGETFVDRESGNSFSEAYASSLAAPAEEDANVRTNDVALHVQNRILAYLVGKDEALAAVVHRVSLEEFESVL